MIPQALRIDDLDFLITEDDQDNFLEKLSLVSKLIFEANVNIESKLREVLPAKEASIILSIFQRYNINLSDTLMLQHFIDNLKSEVLRLPKISIELALEPTEEVLKTISSWFMFQYKKKVILEIKIKPHIIAGAIIEIGGIQKDYSLKKKLEEEYGGKDLMSV